MENFDIFRPFMTKSRRRFFAAAFYAGYARPVPARDLSVTPLTGLRQMIANRHNQ